MKAKLNPINIKVKFGKAIVTLENHNSRVKTKDGVEIYMKQRPGNEFKLWASIPDGTLEQYKHCRPTVVSFEWIETQ